MSSEVPKKSARMQNSEESDSSVYSNESNDEDFADDIKPRSVIISQTGNDLVREEYGKTSAPIFENISISDSSDVHFGNKTFYQGPVTIQQIIYGNKRKTKILKGNENLTNGHPGVDEKYINNQDTIEKETDEVQVPKHLCLKTIYCNYRLFITIVLESNALHVEKQNFSSWNEKENNTLIEAPTDALKRLKPMEVKIVSRLEWLARPPLGEIKDLSFPVPYVIISHTGTENCSSQAKCGFLVRSMQTYHLENKGWSDIAYNFLVGGDCQVYFGRGWTKEGAHTYRYNHKSIGISFIGTFVKTKPPEYQLSVSKELIKLGVSWGYIQQNYKLLGMRQLRPIDSPGDALYKDLQTWDHYSKQP